MKCKLCRSNLTNEADEYDNDLDYEVLEDLLSARGLKAINNGQVSI
jgi:hypothetical protein